MNKDYTFTVEWLEEDQEWVGLCNQFPSLSYLDEDFQKALIGIIQLVNSINNLANKLNDKIIDEDYLYFSSTKDY